VVESTFTVITTQPTANADAGLSAACDAVPDANVLILGIRGAVEFLGSSGFDDPDWAVHQQQISAAIGDLTDALEAVPGTGRFRDWKAALLPLGLDATDLALNTTGAEAISAGESAVDHIAAAKRLTDEFSAEC
jgi:hypothetical protein